MGIRLLALTALLAVIPGQAPAEQTDDRRADEVTLDPRGLPPAVFIDLLVREVIPLLE